MPRYQYIAKDKEGNVSQGEITASSEDDLTRKLYGKGLFITKFESKGGGIRKFFNWQKIARFLASISSMEKVLFARYLQVMLRSGLSLVRSLAILAQQTENPRLKHIIQDLHSRVEKGSPFYEALEKHPRVFSNLFLSIIKTGEVSGKLDNVLDDLSNQMKKDRDLVRKVISAMIYPAIVLVAMFGIGFAMMVFILPQITDIFEDFEVDLPLPTRILIRVGDIIENYGLWVILGMIIVVFLLLRFIRSKTGRKILHPFYLRAPLFGKIVRKFNIARFLRNLGALLSSGLPILEALDIVSDGLGNKEYKKSVKASIDDVRQGNSLGITLGKTPRLFPPIVTQVIQVGEETGTLDTILTRLADFYEEDVDQAMQNLSTIVEPLLMLIMGGLVGAVAISLILPIYTLTSTL